jgi:hypothetical protein
VNKTTKKFMDLNEEEHGSEDEDGAVKLDK